MQRSFAKNKYIQSLSFILILTLLFHTLRNLTPVYFLVYFSIVLITLITSYSVRKINIQNKLLFNIYLLFILFTFWIACWSVLYNSEISLFTSFSRLFFIILIPIILLPINFNNIYIDKVLLLFVFVVLLGALSYPYQYIFGSVSWFNDSAIRGGIDRFSSSLGAITIYGMSAGIALYITFLRITNNIVKVAVTLILINGIFFSLQKAALINILLATLFIFFQLKKYARIKFMVIFILMGSIFFFYSFLNQDHPISIYFQTFLYNTININIFDNPSIRHTQSFSENIITDRLSGLHVTSIIKEHGLLLVTFLGVGITGGGGAMGVDAYQAHNSLWTLYLMGGLPYLAVFLLLYFFTQYSLFKMKNELSNILMMANIIFLANLFASSAAIYHPITSFCFWFSVLFVIKIKIR